MSISEGKNLVKIIADRHKIFGKHKQVRELLNWQTIIKLNNKEYQNFEVCIHPRLRESELFFSLLFASQRWSIKPEKVSQKI